MQLACKSTLQCRKTDRPGWSHALSVEPSASATATAERVLFIVQASALVSLRLGMRARQCCAQLLLHGCR